MCYLFCDVIYAVCIHISPTLAVKMKKILELLYNDFNKHLAHFAFNARRHTSTDLKETVKSMSFFKCNPLWGFKDMGCRQHFCKTPRVILFEVCTMDLKVFWSVQKSSL